MRGTIALIAATLILASCATTGGLETAAGRLDSSAHRFHEEVAYPRGGSHTVDDAAALAEATSDFRRAVNHSRSRDDLAMSFDSVAELYHHLRRQVENRDPRYGDASIAFERVTDAYLDVDRAMNHPASAYHPR